MNDTYLMINGKKIELTTEQKKALGIVEKNCFDRDTLYYCIADNGKVKVTTEGWDDGSTYQLYADERYSVANYCTDANLMEQRALHEVLNRLLWRYSMTHDDDKIDWNDNTKDKWFIYYDKKHNCFEVDYYRTWKTEGVVYFKYRDIANSAIEEIIKPFMKEHPDFIW